MVREHADCPRVAHAADECSTHRRLQHSHLVRPHVAGSILPLHDIPAARRGARADVAGARPASCGRSVVGGVRGWKSDGTVAHCVLPVDATLAAFACSCAALVALLAVSLLFEPGIIGEFLTKGAHGAAVLFDRSDNSSVPGVFRLLGASPGLAYILSLVAGAVAMRRKDQWFWVLAWLGMALSPVAWSYSVAQGFPLAVFVWRMGIHGRLAVLAMALGVLLSTDYFGVSWLIFIASAGAMLLVNALGQERAAKSERPARRGAGPLARSL